MGASLDSSSDIWNPGQLRARCLDNLDFLQRVLDTFCENFAEQLEDLERACDPCDPSRIAWVAHKIKGAAANVAAEQLASCAATLERLGQQQCSDEIPRHVQLLHQKWDEFTESVELWQQSSGQQSAGGSSAAS